MCQRKALLHRVNSYLTQNVLSLITHTGKLMLRIEIIAVTCESKGFAGKTQVSNGKAVDTQIYGASKS